jgi:hypothetical protein
LPSDAVNVIVSPSFAPAIPKVGVVSVVTLSVCDPPLSEVVAKSGATGFDGAVASMVIGNAVDDGEMLPAGSVSVDEMFHVPSVSVGSVQFVAEPMT